MINIKYNYYKILFKNIVKKIILWHFIMISRKKIYYVIKYSFKILIKLFYAIDLNKENKKNKKIINLNLYYKIFLK
jgi:hypothetical protein